GPDHCTSPGGRFRLDGGGGKMGSSSVSQYIEGAGEQKEASSRLGREGGHVCYQSRKCSLARRPLQAKVAFRHGGDRRAFFIQIIECQALPGTAKGAVTDPAHRRSDRDPGPEW